MRLVLILGLIITLSSCNLNPNKVNIELNQKPKIENLKISNNSIRGNLNIDLTSTHKLKISDININISDQNQNLIGILKVDEQICIKHGNNSQLIPFRLYISGGVLRLMPMGLNREKLQNFHLRGSFIVKSGILKKCIKVENISVGDFIQQYLN